MKPVALPPVGHDGVIASLLEPFISLQQRVRARIKYRWNLATFLVQVGIIKIFEISFSASYLSRNAKKVFESNR